MRTYGDTMDDAALCIRETADGGYILSGFTERVPGNLDAWFIRTDMAGDTLWTSPFDFGGDELLYSVHEMADGGFIAAGFTSSLAPAGSTDVLVIKVDADGGAEWKDYYIGPGHDRGYGMCQTSDGNYVITGYTEVGSDRGDVLLVKIDSSNGDTIWTRTYGDTTLDRGRAIRETYDGGLIVGGSITDYAPYYYRGYLLRTDSNGDSLWTKAFGTPLDWQRITTVAETPDLGYICGGARDTSTVGNSDYHFIKTDSDGDTLWTKTLGDDELQAIGCLANTRDRGYVAVGYTRDLSELDYNIYIVKLGQDEAGVSQPDVCGSGFFRIGGANPFRNRVPIIYYLADPSPVKLAVYDVAGRQVAVLDRGLRSKGPHSVTWDCRGVGGGRVADGVYFVRCDTGKRSAVYKVVILR
jgi:hypothetical protein